MRRFAILAAVILTVAASASAEFSQEIALSAPHAEDATVSIATIAMNGREGLVAWQQKGNLTSDLYIRRISDEGEFLADPTLLFANATVPFQRPPTVVAAGDRYLVLWPVGNGTFLAVVGADGFIIRNELLPERDVHRIAADAAWNGRVFLAIWNLTRSSIAAGAEATFLDADGSFTGAPIALPDESIEDVASDGRDFVILTRKNLPTPGCSGACRILLVSRHASSSGELSSETVVRDVDRVGGHSLDAARLASTGTGYALVTTEFEWTPQSMIRVEPLDQAGLPAAEPATLYSSAAPGTSVLDVLSTGDGNVAIRFGDKPALIVETATPGSTSMVQGAVSALQWTGRSFLVVRDGKLDVLMRDFSPDRSRPQQVPLARVAASQEDPEIAAAADSFGVVWSEIRSGVREIRARVIGATEMLLGTGSMPVVASDGRDFMAAYTAANGRVVVQRFNAQPVQLPGTPAADGLPVVQYADAIVWNGAEYLVVVRAAGTRSRLYAVRVSRDGVVIDQPVPISDSERFASHAAAAWSGREYLVAWTDSQCSRACEARTVMQKLSATAAPLGNDIAPSAGTITDVVWTGSEFVVLTDNARGAALVIAYERMRDVYVRGLMNEAVAATPDEEFDPAVAVSRHTVAVAYVRRAHEPEYGGTNRIFVRFSEETPRRRAVGRVW